MEVDNIISLFPFTFVLETAELQMKPTTPLEDQLKGLLEIEVRCKRAIL